MACPFCKNQTTSSTTFPENIFNSKTFNYRRCKECKLVYLNPFPDGDDYIAMYPPAYHDGVVDKTLQADISKKKPGLRFSYKHQFDLIRNQVGPTASILDYGCGNGNFMVNAIHHGFKCDGAEFSPEYLLALKKAIPESSFFTVDMLLQEPVGKYDVIRLSNVLEHLTEPVEIIRRITQNLNPNGILLVEGPVEENFCIAAAFRKIYFRFKKILRPGYKVTAPPYHIFLSDRSNQREFFQRCGFVESHYRIAEDAWPFPSSFSDAKGLMQKCTAIIAKFSKGCSKVFNKNWGNIFIYTGTRYKN